MKKIVPVVIVFLVLMLVWNMYFSPALVSMDFDGEHVDGPLAALAGLLFAGGGMIVAVLVTLLVGVVLAVVFAGVGILVLAALSLAGLILAAATAPFLLPLLIPIAIIWLLARRSRRTSRAG